jgi:hypothetical protein
MGCGGLAYLAEAERRHLPHFRIRIGEQLRERRHAFRQPNASDGQRGAPPDPRLPVAE